MLACLERRRGGGGEARGRGQEKTAIYDPSNKEGQLFFLGIHGDSPEEGDLASSLTGE